jgi:hypothetical protein
LGLLRFNSIALFFFPYPFTFWSLPYPHYRSTADSRGGDSAEKEAAKNHLNKYEYFSFAAFEPS